MIEIESPLGPLAISANRSGIESVRFIRASARVSDECELPCDLELQCSEELQRYFEGSLKEFSVPLHPTGSPFYREVWSAIQKIPYGRTKSYGEIASELGRPKAARAVGQANNRNPIVILFPCHRVIGNRGDLTGYAPGLHLKSWLLRHEEAMEAGVDDGNPGSKAKGARFSSVA